MIYVKKTLNIHIAPASLLPSEVHLQWKFHNRVHWFELTVLDCWKPHRPALWQELEKFTSTKFNPYYLNISTHLVQILSTITLQVIQDTWVFGLSCQADFQIYNYSWEKAVDTWDTIYMRRKWNQFPCIFWCQQSHCLQSRTNFKTHTRSHMRN